MWLLTYAELEKLLEPCPPAGSRWRHTSGTLYTVTGCALGEKNHIPLVLYQPDGGRVVWARPLAQWAERFTEVKADA